MPLKLLMKHTRLIKQVSQAYRPDHTSSWVLHKIDARLKSDRVGLPPAGVAK